MTDILTINRAKWRTGSDSKNQTGYGDTNLLNKEGYMCCLGFLCNQLGIPKKDLLNKPDPESLEWEVIPDLLNEYGSNSSFCNKAMKINDRISITIEQREEEIKKHFAKKNVKVVFVGKYTPIKLKTK